MFLDKSASGKNDVQALGVLQPEKQDSTPCQRSFHSTLIMGSCMVVYGVNTNIHHDNELWYDYKMYLYYFGCYSWARVKER